MNYKLTFPSLKDIKSCQRHPNPNDKEEYKYYDWDIFTLYPLHTYCRIRYNENDNGKLYLDMMQDGYCDRCSISGFNSSYPATQRGYNELKKVCEHEYNKLVSELLNSNNTCSQLWDFC